MKNNLSLLLLLTLLGSSAFFLSCNKNNCEGDKTIENIAPSSNPVGYEVIISIKGFSNAAQVKFGNEAAETRAGEANQIVARVPAGLAGNVQVTVEEGDCVARFDNFKVLAHCLVICNQAFRILYCPYRHQVLQMDLPTLGSTRLMQHLPRVSNWVMTAQAF